ncbi:Mucolipin-2 [Balamuthia mandrillaris]
MSSFNESRMTERYPLLALHDEEEEEEEQEDEEDEEPEDDSNALVQQRPAQTARGKRRQRRSPGRSSFTSSAPPSTAGSWDPSAAPHILDEPNQGQRRTQPLPAPLHKRHTEHALGRKGASRTSTPSPRKSNTYNLSRRTRSSGGLQRGRQKRLQQSHPNLTGGGDKRKVNAEEGGGEGEEIKEEDEDKQRRKEERSGKESESDSEKRRSAYEELLALGGFKSSKDAHVQQPAFVPSTRKEPDLLAQTLQRLLTLFRRPRMTLKDTMLLSPWQKWKKYNRVPWKIFLHLFMFLVVVVQVLLIYVETSQYFYANQRVFHKVFLGVDSDTFRQELYTIDDTLEHISTTVLNYYNVDNITADKYPHVLTTSDGTKARAQGLLIPLEEIYGRSNDSEDTDKTIQPVDMELILYERDFYNFNTSEPYGWTLATDDVETEEEEYELTLENPLGPFGTNNESAVQALFHRVVEIKLKFSLYNLDIGSLGPVPFLWNIEQTYSKTSGFVLANLVATKRVFYSEAKGLNPQILFTIFNCLTFGLAMLSALLDCKSCVSRYKLYRMAKRQYLAIPEETRKDEGYPKWSELSFFDTKAQFFSLWVVFMIFTSCCLMTASVLGIFEELGKLSSIYFQLFQGLGALGVAVNILRYLEYGQNFYTLILSLQLSAPRIARFIISAFPIFFGFMLMGIIMFSPYSSRFQDFTSTGVTLFSLLNGDEIRSTFEELGVTYPIRTLPTIYLYVFVGLFITAILNIFIFIIEDSYHAAKASQRANQLKRLKGTSDGTVSIREPLFSQRDTQDSGTTGGSNAERFDIFRLFEILEREYNVDESDEEEDDDEDDDYVDSDADEPTSEDGTILSSTEKDKQDEADTGAQPPQKQEQSQQGEEEEEEEGESEKDKEKPQRPTLVVSPSGGGFFDVQPHGNINSDPISLPVRPRYTQPPPSIGRGGVDPRRRPSSTTGATTTSSSTSTASPSGDDTITPLAATVEERNRIIRMKQREMEEIRRIRERIRQMQKEKENMERAAAGSSGRFLQIREEGGSGSTDSRRYSGDATSPMERNLMDIDLKITYKKLKKDMQEIIISNQKEFEKEVTSAIAAVKQKYDAKLQRKLRKQVKKSFHHLSPSSIPLPSQPTQTTTRVPRAASPASSSAASASASSSTPTNNNNSNNNNNNNAANMV